MDKIVSSQSGNTLKSQTAVDQSSGGAGDHLGMDGHSGASGRGFIPDPNPGEAFPGGGKPMGKIGSRLGEA